MRGRPSAKRSGKVPSPRKSDRAKRGEHLKAATGCAPPREHALREEAHFVFSCPPRNLPHAGGQTREIGGAERSRLDARRTLDRKAHDVGAALKQEVVAARASVHGKRADGDSGVLSHAGKDVVDLKRLRLEAGTRKMGTRGSPRQPVDRAACIGIPIRCAETGKGGDDAHAGRVGHT